MADGAKLPFVLVPIQLGYDEGGLHHASRRRSVPRDGRPRGKVIEIGRYFIQLGKISSDLFPGGQNKGDAFDVARNQGQIDGKALGLMRDRAFGSCWVVIKNEISVARTLPDLVSKNALASGARSAAVGDHRNSTTTLLVVGPWRVIEMFCPVAICIDATLAWGCGESIDGIP